VAGVAEKSFQKEGEGKTETATTIREVKGVSFNPGGEEAPFLSMKESEGRENSARTRQESLWQVGSPTTTSNRPQPQVPTSVH